MYLYLVIKNHYHIKGVTVRASDTVELNLKVRLVEPDNTCSETNNAGHSPQLTHLRFKNVSKTSQKTLDNVFM